VYVYPFVLVYPDGCGGYRMKLNTVNLHGGGELLGGHGETLHSDLSPSPGTIARVRDHHCPLSVRDGIRGDEMIGEGGKNEG
jgi:hypothetical protein